MNPALKIDLIADESVDANITALLRAEGYSVWSVSEETPSVSDTVVLAAAFEKSVLLLTEDKDFGELAIRLKRPHCGILLIRLSGLDSNEKAIIGYCNNQTASQRIAKFIFGVRPIQTENKILKQADRSNINPFV